MADTGASGRTTPRRKDPRGTILSVIIIALLLIVGYLSYSLVQRHFLQPPVIAERSVAPGEIIQMDVLNGCGISGVASTFTSYLRARGYDVVEMRNYKTFGVPQSLVIDRIGDLQTAKKVAYALGVSEKNIVQQINEDYFVDVSVVIGKDYNSLKPSH